MSNPKEMENAETVTEKREKVIAKVEIEGMSKIKELKELETTKELEELGIEKITHMWRRWGTPQNFCLKFID